MSLTEKARSLLVVLIASVAALAGAVLANLVCAVAFAPQSVFGFSPIMALRVFIVGGMGGVAWGAVMILYLHYRGKSVNLSDYAP